MNRIRRVLFLKRSFKKKGGLEKQAKLIVQAFQELGHEITLFTEEVDEMPPFETIFCKKSIGLSFSKIYHFNEEAKRFIHSRKYDHIFGFDRTEEQSILRLGNGIHKSFLEKKKLILPWYRNFLPKNPQDYITLQIEKKGFSSPNLQTVITNSAMVKEELLSYYPVPASKIHVLHNGVEWEKNHEAFKEQFNIDPKKIPFVYDKSKVQLLFIGHGYARKGLLFLLKALSYVPTCDFELHVVGSDKNIDFFKQFAQKLNLHQSIHFHGATSCSTPFFQIADLCIIPSIYDPFANVTIEALSYGIPVLTSKMNGGKEIIQSFMGSEIDCLQDASSFGDLIKNNLRKKQQELSTKIRNGVEYLDFSYQLKKLTEICI